MEVELGLKLIDYEFAMVRLDRSYNIFKIASDYPVKKFMVFDSGHPYVLS